MMAIVLQRIEEASKSRQAYLDLSNLNLKNIPREISELPWLEILNLSHNRIENTNGLESLKNLRELNLSHNEVKTLNGVCRLEKLNVLYLGNNELEKFHIEDVFDIKKIQILDLTHNNLVILPLELFHEKFNFHWASILGHNPLASPPIEVIMQGDEAISQYINSLENIRPLNQAKILLVGDGGSGKTSLVKRIFNHKFNESENQTHGINVQKCSFKVGKEEIIANFWDFGGQEIMHATHKFFLTKRSIYLLVVDTRKEDKVEYWLKHIETFGGNSPVFVILNKIDQNPLFDLNRAFLQRKYENIKGFFKISCKSRKGVDDFITALLEELNSLEMRKTPFPKSWFEVMNVLNFMKEDYISYEQYYALCQLNGVKNKKAQDTLLQFLHDLGVVLHFKRLKLHDTQVLNPSWLTNAVYRIINSEAIREDEGILYIENLFQILNKDSSSNDSKFSKFLPSILPKNKYINEKYYYPENKFLYIIQIMKDFELCYNLNEGIFIVPDLLPVEEKLFSFDYEGSLRFTISYEFLPSSIFPKLMIKMKYNDLLLDDLIWRTGIVLFDEIFKVKSVVKIDKEENKLNIWVKGEQKIRQREFLTYIRNTIKYIHRDFDKLTFEELIPIPKFGDIYIDYQELLGYEEMGLKEFPIGKLRKNFSVDALLSGIEETSSRKELLANKDINIVVLYHNIDSVYRKELFKTLNPIISFDRINYWDESLLNKQSDNRQEILTNFNKADIVIALISEEFLVNEDLNELVRQCLIRNFAKENTLVPIIIDDCKWKNSSLNGIEPIFETPISYFNERDKAWLIVFDKIKNQINYLRGAKQIDRVSNQPIYLENINRREVKEMIAASKIGEAIKYLMEVYNKYENEKYNDLVLLSSELNIIEKTEVIGILSYEESLRRRSRIISSLLKIIDSN